MGNTIDQTFEQAVNKTVNWWAEKMQAPMNQNNGDDCDSGGLTLMLSNLVSQKAQQTISSENIKLFKSNLKNQLMSMEGQRVCLSVGYHPCQELATSAQAAGIDVMCFPYKTTSWINEKNLAMASYQYRGELREI